MRKQYYCLSELKQARTKLTAVCVSATPLKRGGNSLGCGFEISLVGDELLS
jgi:hypothetical protein